MRTSTKSFALAQSWEGEGGGDKQTLKGTTNRGWENASGSEGDVGVMIPDRGWENVRGS